MLLIMKECPLLLLIRRRERLRQMEIEEIALMRLKGQVDGQQENLRLALIRFSRSLPTMMEMKQSPHMIGQNFGAKITPLITTKEAMSLDLELQMLSLFRILLVLRVLPQASIL
ncbi:MAG TPA: hypothetical protein DD643_07885 [Synechococcus sp. UBA8638]|nr:hypothetical protein [Synechococcus sp. UBA8638]